MYELMLLNTEHDPYKEQILKSSNGPGFTSQISCVGYTKGAQDIYIEVTRRSVGKHPVSSRDLQCFWLGNES